MYQMPNNANASSSNQSDVNYFDYRNLNSNPSLYSESTTSSSFLFNEANNVSPPIPEDSNDDSNLLYGNLILPASHPNSPYHISLPVKTAVPTQELAKRFTIWKKIIKQLIFYFKEVAVLRQHYYQLNLHMLDNIQFLSGNSKNKKGGGNSGINGGGGMNTMNSGTMSPGGNSINNSGNGLTPNQDIFFGSSEDKFINSSFLPINSKSVQSIPATLFNYHKSLSEKELITYSELTLKIIPRLENLKKSLNFKIKEILNLKSDFKFTRLRTEVAMTGQILNSYISSIEMLEKGYVTANSWGQSTDQSNSTIKISGKNDPYLLKLQLDLQLKKQLLEENYLKEAFVNLQNSALELEKIIYKELQNAMKNYSKLINTEIESVKISLINDLSDNFLQNNQSIDWNYFINNDNNKNFIKIDNTDALKIKKLSDISYPYQQKLLGKCIRSGYLEKKSKFLKNYSRFFYVLTLNYFHEFKTNDRKKDPYPISSINLNQCVLTDYENDRKLILHTRNNNGSTMNYVFKCNDSKELTKWYNDLKELTSFNDSIERNRYFELKYKDGYNNSINSSSSASTDFTKNSGSTNQSSISGSSGDLQGSTLSLPKINNNANSSTGNFLKNHKKSSSSSSSLLQKSLNFNQSLPKPKSATNLSNLKNNALSTGSGGSSSFSDTSTLNTPGSDSTPRAEDAHKAGQITMHLNLSNQNLIPNIVVGESPSGLDTASSRSTPTNTLRVSGRPIPGEGGDYFGNIANNSTSQGEGGTRHSSLPIVASNSSNSSLTNMRNQGAATSPSGQRTPPVANKNNKKFNYRIQLPSPQGNLNQMVMHMNSNGGTPNPGNIPQTPGELPNHSVSEIINDFQHTHIDNANYDEEHNNTQ